MAFILPQIEQQPLFDQAEFPRNDFFNGVRDSVENVLVPLYRCPSTALPDQFTTSTPNAMIPDYVAISGNVGGFGGLPGPTSQTDNFAFGIVARNGIFYDNSTTTIADIRDGSSNTLMVSETGDFLNLGGELEDVRAGSQHGFHAGWQFNTSSHRLFNCVTMRFVINPGSSFEFTTDSTDGVSRLGHNSPLRSGHPGGVQGLLGDASVQFISDTLAPETLAQLSNRFDGEVIGEF